MTVIDELKAWLEAEKIEWSHDDYVSYYPFFEEVIKKIKELEARDKS